MHDIWMQWHCLAMHAGNRKRMRNQPGSRQVRHMAMYGKLLRQTPSTRRQGMCTLLPA
jgi:hypothetical protein